MVEKWGLPAQTVRSALISALLLVLMVYLVFLAGSTPGWVNPALFLLASAAWLATARAQSGIELPAAVLLAVFVGAACLSYDPRRSLDQVWTIACGVLILFCANSISQSALFRRRLLVFGLLLGGLAMAWSWWDASRWYQGWLAAEPGRWLPTVSFRLNGSNNLAAYYNILLMPALAYTLLGKNRLARIILGGYAVSALLLIYLTSSRGGWFGTAAGVFCLAILAALSGRVNIQRVWRNPWSWAALVAGGLALIGFAWGYLTAMQAHPTHASFFDARPSYWIPAWRAFLQSPLWGVGLNVYASFHMSAYSYPPQLIYLHAHNQYLDVLMGAGLIGAVACGWFFAALGLQFRARFRARWGDAQRLKEALPGDSRADFILTAGVVAALATYLVHGIFDGLYRMSFASITLLIFLGAALAVKQAANPPLAKHLKIGVALVWMALAVYGLWMTWAVAPIHQAVERYQRGDLAGAAQAYAAAVHRDPANAAARQQRAILYSLQAAQGNQPALEVAIREFTAAAALDPTWGLNHANLGALYAASGNLEQAERELKRAVEAAPGAPLCWLNYALVLEAAGEAAGDAADAKQAYLRVLEIQPDLYPAAFWRATPLRRELAPLRLADDRDYTALKQLAEDGAAWGIDLARLAAFYRQQGQFEAAARELKKARLAFFLMHSERTEITWQEAELFAAQGDWTQAVRVGELALDDVRRQGSYGIGSYGKVDYVSLVFGAPALAEELAPQLTRLPVSDLWAARWESLRAWYTKLGNHELARQRAAEIQRLTEPGAP